MCGHLADPQKEQGTRGTPSFMTHPLVCSPFIYRSGCPFKASVQWLYLDRVAPKDLFRSVAVLLYLSSHKPSATGVQFRAVQAAWWLYMEPFDQVGIVEVPWGYLEPSNKPSTSSSSYRSERRHVQG